VAHYDDVAFRRDDTKNLEIWGEGLCLCVPVQCFCGKGFGVIECVVLKFCLRMEVGKPRTIGVSGGRSLAMNPVSASFSRVYVPVLLRENRHARCEGTLEPQCSRR